MSNLDNEIKKIKKYKRMEIAELEDQIEYYEKQIIKAKKENKTEDLNEY